MPGSAYTWVGSAAFELPPSPKLQLWPVMVPPGWVLLSPENDTASGAGPEVGSATITAVGDVFTVVVEPGPDGGAHAPASSTTVPTMTTTAVARMRIGCPVSPMERSGGCHPAHPPAPATSITPDVGRRCSGCHIRGASQT